MKKIGYLTFAALLAFGSCTNEINEEGFVDKANTISFNAYPNKTRAYTNGDIDNATAMRDGSFGVVGYKSDNNIYLGTTSKAVEQKWQSNDWGYADPTELHFWPEGAMDFYAYFPFSSENGDTFAANNTTSNVMTINNTKGNQDVLFAYKGSQTYTNRVQLDFKHALSKIKEVNIQVAIDGIEVEVSKVEFLNTCIGGKIIVDNTGNASYEAQESPTTCAYEISPAVSINRTNTAAVSNSKYQSLFGNDANKYLFATNSTISQNVKGTGKTLWDGKKDGWSETDNINDKGLVCMKLTCKVKKTNPETYLVGNATQYADMYIPMAGTYAVGSQGEDVSSLLAGKRYTYNIIMKDNVGFKENGDPILNPILFTVDNVASWHDVTVTITL